MNKSVRGVLPDSYLTVLGAITAMAAETEYLIELILLGLLGMDQRYGGAAIRWISHPQQIGLIKKILKERYGEESAEYIGISRAINDVSKSLDERNDAVHAIWSTEGETTFRGLLKRGQFDALISEHDIKALIATKEKLIVRMVTLGSVASELDIPFPVPSLDTPPGQSVVQSLFEGHDPQVQNSPPPASEE